MNTTSTVKAQKVRCIRHRKFTRNPETDTKVILSKNVIDMCFVPKIKEIDDTMSTSIPRNEDGSSTIYISDDGFKKFFEYISEEGINAMIEFQNDVESGKYDVNPEVIKILKGFSCLCDYSYQV